MPTRGRRTGRTARRLLLLAATVASAGVAGAAAGPAPALADPLPKAVGVPGGVYRGTATIDGRRCRTCTVRIVLTDDGRELLSTSVVGVCGRSTLDLATLRPDRRFRGELASDDGSTLLGIVRGRVSPGGTRLRGSGTIRDAQPYCGARRVAFTARLTGARRPRPGTTLTCEPMDLGDRTNLLVLQRDVGCGAAHALARRAVRARACADLATGGSCRAWEIACAATAAPEFDPAAQIRCTPPAPSGAAVEIVWLRWCFVAPTDFSAYAPRAVPCGTARAVAAAYEQECLDAPSPCTAAGFECRRPTVSTVRHRLDIERRCTDPADARRIVVLRVEYGDAV